MLTYLKAKARAKGRNLELKPPSTFQIYTYYVEMFCEYAEKKPDDLIKERKAHLKSDDDLIRLQHEELANNFISHLGQKKMKSNTVATALSAVRTFYSTNYLTLEEKVVIVPSGKAEKSVWLPENTDLLVLVEKAHEIKNLRSAAFICCAKDSGIGIGDMLDITWELESMQYGPLKQQLKRGQCPIHIAFKREKTQEKFDTFFGEDAVNALNEYADFSGRIFKISSNQIRLDLKKLDMRLRPHTLRKFFDTYMKMSVASILSERGTFGAAGISDTWVEYWMGHSLGKVKGAYNIPPVKLQMEVYQKAYPRIKMVK